MAELSEIVPGSRWLDNDGDLTVILAPADGTAMTTAWLSRRHEEWHFDEVYPTEEEADFFTNWTPYTEPAKCPDFERYVGLDGGVDPEVYGDIDTRLTGLIYDAFVFRIGVKDGEPFIEAVTK